MPHLLRLQVLLWRECLAIPLGLRIAILLACYFTCLTGVGYSQSRNEVPSVREYLDALAKQDSVAARAICDSWIETGTATKNPGLTAQGIARQAHADAWFATVPFEERKANLDKALAMVPSGSSVWRANVLIAAGSHNGAYGNDIAGGLALVEEGLLYAGQLGNDTLLAEGYCGAARSLAFLEQNSRGMDFSLRALRYAEAAKDDNLINSAVQMVHALAIFSDCLNEAQPVLQSYADRLSTFDYHMFVAHFGTKEEQAQLLPTVLGTLKDESADQKLRGLSGASSSLILQNLGRAEEALEPLRQGREIIKGADPTTEAELAETEFHLLMKLGQTEQALTVGQDALSQLRTQGYFKPARAVARKLGKAYLALGRAEESDRMLKLADELGNELLSSFFQQSDYAAKQAFDFDMLSREQTRRLREQEQTNLRAEKELNRTRSIAFGIPVLGLVFWSMFQLRATGKQRKLLAEQVEKKTQSLTEATLEAQALRERAEAANQALRDSEAKYRQLVEDSADVTWLGELNGHVIYLSPQFETLFGFNPNDWVGETNFELVHPDDRKTCEVELTKLRNDPTKPITIEFRHLCSDGSYTWVMAKATAVLDAEGNVIRHHGVLRDISERKSAELALQDTQAQLQRMTENVPGMIYRYRLRSDGSHAIDYVSSRVRELYEIEPAEARENPMALFVCLHPEDANRVSEAIKESARQLSPFEEEFRVILPTHGVRWRHTISRPTRADNGDTVFDGVAFDITHRKHSELQLQLANEGLAFATKMKDEFLANMSHELRTPLNAILGMNEGLQRGIFGPVTEKQQNSFEVIQQSGAHLLELINEVLDLAKIESGAMQPELTSVDVSELCDSAMKLVAQQADKKNIGLNLRSPIGLPKLNGDEKRLRQVLVNLLSNAVKFTPAGGQVTVQVERKQAAKNEKQMLQIAVSDTGIGIAAEHLATLFDPFVQVDSSLTREYPGTGLGLALVRRFVEMHGGRVAVESEVGVGSCFTVELPYETPAIEIANAVAPEAESSDAVLPMAGPANGSPNGSASATGTVLLAEDNTSVAKATALYLESANLSVVLATNGEMAIDLAQVHRPNVILMDIQMPGLDGLTAIKRIRSIGGMERTPIVALTGLAMPADEIRCIDAGANLYLSKPYSLAKVVETIHDLLAHQ